MTRRCSGKILCINSLASGRLAVAAAFDFGQHADAPQQMLVHRVVVVHIELHHGDDLAEGRHKVAEHAGLVHPPQHGFRVVLRRENVDEQLVGFLVLAQFGIDQLERARDGAHGVGMECEIVLLRQIEDPDQVDRIALEDVGLGEANAVLVDDKIIAFGKLAALHGPQPRHHTAQDRHALGVAIFQFGAQNRREIADVLGDQEVVLHEAFDVLQSGMLGVTEPHRNLALNIE